MTFKYKAHIALTPTRRV